MARPVVGIIDYFAAEPVRVSAILRLPLIGPIAVLVWIWEVDHWLPGLCAVILGVYAAAALLWAGCRADGAGAAVGRLGLDFRRPFGDRHTFATELANANVSVYTLMKLLGHDSMVTSQRYVDGAGADTESAAELNPIYELIAADRRPS